MVKVLRNIGFGLIGLAILSMSFRFLIYAITGGTRSVGHGATGPVSGLAYVATGILLIVLMRWIQGGTDTVPKKIYAALVAFALACIAIGIGVWMGFSPQTVSNNLGWGMVGFITFAGILILAMNMIPDSFARSFLSIFLLVVMGTATYNLVKANFPPLNAAFLGIIFPNVGVIAVAALFVAAVVLQTLKIGFLPKLFFQVFSVVLFIAFIGARFILVADGLLDAGAQYKRVFPNGVISSILPEGVGDWIKEQLRVKKPVHVVTVSATYADWKKVTPFEPTDCHVEPADQPGRATQLILEDSTAASLSYLTAPDGKNFSPSGGKKAIGVKTWQDKASIYCKS